MPPAQVEGETLINMSDTDSLLGLRGPGMGDAVGLALQAALDGLQVRQEVISDNVANIDTPGFRATGIDFESALTDAIDDGDFRRAADGSPQAGFGIDNTTTRFPTTTPPGHDGNNVDLRKESLAAIQTQFQYQLISRAASDRFDTVRAVTSMH